MALVEAAGGADGDDGAISVHELAARLERRLPRIAQEHTGREQRAVVSRGAEDFVVLR